VRAYFTRLDQLNSIALGKDLGEPINEPATEGKVPNYVLRMTANRSSIKPTKNARSISEKSLDKLLGTSPSKKSERPAVSSDKRQVISRGDERMNIDVLADNSSPVTFPKEEKTKPLEFEERSEIDKALELLEIRYRCLIAQVPDERLGAAGCENILRLKSSELERASQLVCTGRGREKIYAYSPLDYSIVDIASNSHIASLRRQLEAQTTSRHMAVLKRESQYEEVRGGK